MYARLWFDKDPQKMIRTLKSLHETHSERHPVFSLAEATRLSHAVARSRGHPLRKGTKPVWPAQFLSGSGSVFSGGGSI